MTLKIRNISKLPYTQWAGGTTTQLFISPDNLTVKDDFNIRISSATIDAGSSNFSDFSSYNRFLTVLQGETTLTNDSTSTKIKIEELTPYYFSGSDKISSYNTNSVIDFNVIWKKDLERPCINNSSYAEYSQIKLEEIKKTNINKIFILSLENNNSIKNNISKEKISLNKFDFIIIDDLNNFLFKGKYLVVTL